jgi:hypothetical protein
MAIKTVIQCAEYLNGNHENIKYSALSSDRNFNLGPIEYKVGIQLNLLGVAAVDTMDAPWTWTSPATQIRS